MTSDGITEAATGPADVTAPRGTSGTDSKAQVRSEVRAARKARRRDERAAGVTSDGEAERIAQAVISHLDSCPAAAEGGWGSGMATVAAFRSTPSEPDTSTLLDALLDRGARVLVPRTRDDMALEWHELLPHDRRRRPDPVATNPPEAWDPAGTGSPDTGDDGTAELPSADDTADEGPSLGLDAVADIAAMILPGIAVDPAGHRLGQGGGCYDRTLPRLRAGTCRAVLLFDEEVRDTVPFGDHDRPVPAVVTPGGGWRNLGPTADAAGTHADRE